MKYRYKDTDTYVESSEQLDSATFTPTDKVEKKSEPKKTARTTKK
jgi:hypothetical protein